VRLYTQLECTGFFAPLPHALPHEARPKRKDEICKAKQKLLILHKLRGNPHLWGYPPPVRLPGEATEAKIQEKYLITIKYIMEDN